MAHSADLILTLTGALSAALGLGLVTHRLRLSPIVGYLMAGVLIGPFTPGFVAHPELARELAEVGVVLLMFGVGLHFHVKELWAVRRVAIPGAMIQIVVATLLGLLLTQSFGWSFRADLDPVVIELNHETVQGLQKQGISAVYGDASQQAILELAGAERAVGLIFAAAGSPPEAVVRLAKQLHPAILVLARVAFMHESAELGHAGADVVIAAEAEVALAMAERLLTALGATAEQLDRERVRVRAELLSA